MRSFVDFYAVLGVHPTSSQEAIRAAYRQMAKRYHPDVASTTHPTQKMQIINEAYQVLGHPDRRLKYDRLRYAIRVSQEATARSGYRAPSPPRPPHAGPFGTSAHDSPASQPPKRNRQSYTSGSAPYQESTSAQTTPAFVSRLIRQFARAFFPPKSWQPLLLLVAPTLYILFIATGWPGFFGACILAMVVYGVLDLIAFRSHPPRPP